MLKQLRTLGSTMAAVSSCESEKDHDKGEELDIFSFTGLGDDNATDRYTVGRAHHSLKSLLFFFNVWV